MWHAVSTSSNKPKQKTAKHAMQHVMGSAAPSSYAPLDISAAASKHKVASDRHHSAEDVSGFGILVVASFLVGYL